MPCQFVGVLTSRLKLSYVYVNTNNDDIVTLLVLSFHSFRSDRKLLVANSLPQNLLKLNKINK